MSGLLDISSSNFYASWFTIMQIVHVVFFGMLLLTPKWRATAFPLLISGLFYIKTSPLITFLGTSGYPIESYIVKAIIDTIVCTTVFAYGCAGRTRQTIILAIFSFIHIAAAIEYPMKDTVIIYSIYLPATLFLNVLQVLVMGNAISELRNIRSTFNSYNHTGFMQRIFYSWRFSDDKKKTRL